MDIILINEIILTIIIIIIIFSIISFVHIAFVTHLIYTISVYYSLTLLKISVCALRSINTARTTYRHTAEQTGLSQGIHR